MSVIVTGVRSARSNARRRTAWSKQAVEPAHSQAPRPGLAPADAPWLPSGRRAIRSSCIGGSLAAAPDAAALRVSAN